MSFNNVYKGKTVLVTGHTGFKGSWMTEWLLQMGAEVVGYALDPPSNPSHFEKLELGSRLLDDIRADIRSLEDIKLTLRKHKPDFIFHLAAQPLVIESFNEPRYTFETNLMGTVNLLEAVRLEKLSTIMILITTDKVYENREWLYSYRENDSLGGYDPYSASKATADIAISSYTRSFFNFLEIKPDSTKVAVASARGGNVIGGGDWAENRILPDCVRHLSKGEPIPVRNKYATRPWQHVLDLLGGYLHLGAEMYSSFNSSAEEDLKRLFELSSAFNIAPDVTSNRPVGELVSLILEHWPGEWQDNSDPSAKHEAGRLSLSNDKAYHLLGWQPQWDFSETIKYTVEWYKEFYSKKSPSAEFVRELSRGQIKKYSESMKFFKIV